MSEDADNFIIVTDDEETGTGKMEIPLEPEGTLRLSTVSHAFDGALGLKYKNPNTDAFRALRIDDDGLIYPPNEGWGIGKTLYYVIYQKKAEKRKQADESSETNGAAKVKRVGAPARKCSDLVALGIPFTTTEDELKAFFEKFGEIVVSQVKKDYKTGKSKGFGFIRFANYESQIKALRSSHTMEGRPVTLKVPNSKSEVSRGVDSSKVFVGRVPESMTENELRDYFEQFGEVVDVFLPRPFRAFAFVTFADADVAMSVCDEDYVIGNSSVRVSRPAPSGSKAEKFGAAKNQQSDDYYEGNSGGGSGSGGYTGGYYGGEPKREEKSERYAEQQQQAQAWSSGGYGYGYGYPWGYYNPYAHNPWAQQQQQQQPVPPPPANKPSSSSGGPGGSNVNVSVSPQALQQAVQAALRDLIPSGGRQADMLRSMSGSSNQYGSVSLTGLQGLTRVAFEETLKCNCETFFGLKTCAFVTF